MSGFVPPVVGVFDTPTTSLAINVEWRSYIVGVLESLLTDCAFNLGNDVYMSHTPPVWSGDDDAQFLADNEIQKIISALGNGQNLVEIPSGTIQMYIGTTAPDGWLMCDGSEYFQWQYPELVAVLPDLLINDITGRFNTPDMVRHMPIGADGDLYPLADTGGSATHILSIAEMPIHTHIQHPHNHTQNSHNHTQNSHNHNQDGHQHTVINHGHDVNVTAPTAALGGGAIALSNAAANATRGSNGATPATSSVTATNQAATAVNNAATAVNQEATATNQNTGSGAAHNNLPPYTAVNFIIKT